MQQPPRGVLQQQLCAAGAAWAAAEAMGRTTVGVGAAADAGAKPPAATAATAAAWLLTG